MNSAAIAATISTPQIRGMANFFGTPKPISFNARPANILPSYASLRDIAPVGITTLGITVAGLF